jgi:hypothetical protein
MSSVRRHRLEPAQSDAGVSTPDAQQHEQSRTGIIAAVDTNSKRILIAWITCDVVWALLFIRALKRAHKAS